MKPGHDRNRHARPSRRAFTFVELLVVITIIAILLALLIPAYTRAHQMVLQTSCMSNMRQIGLGLIAYVNDNEGSMPNQDPTTDVSNFDDPGVTTPSFLGLIRRYIHNYQAVYVCPTAWSITWTGAKESTAYSSTNYQANAVVMDCKITRVTHASSVVMVQEDKMLWSICWLRPWMAVRSPPTYTWWHFDGDGYGEEYDALHYNDVGGNLVFVDGHAEYRPYQMLTASDFGLTGGAGVNGSPTDNNMSNYNNLYYASP